MINRWILFVFFACSSFTKLRADVKLLNETLEISPSKDDSFKWPYVLYVPSSIKKPTMIVLPTNTGMLDDDIEVHANDVRKYMSQDGAYMARELNAPVLMPVFPRPKSEPLLYTHALNRRSLETRTKGLARLDLQLIAMIEHARKILASKDITIESKVFMLGFSASGMFTNRFTILHPKTVKAVAFGSPGGWPIAPLSNWEGKNLRYPVGISDLKDLVGEKFDSTAFRSVPIYYFLGAKDLNDSVIFRDSFDKQDEDLIRDAFGNIVPERWDYTLQIYKKAGCNCTFKLYPNIGHQMDGEVWKDVIHFFKENNK